jgi:16S rRNA C1402 (ribose-2'-O) methylase RsmI
MDPGNPGRCRRQDMKSRVLVGAAAAFAAMMVVGVPAQDRALILAEADSMQKAARGG